MRSIRAFSSTPSAAGAAVRPAAAQAQAHAHAHATAEASRAAVQCTLSGMQPTGMPHLGNYIGALRNWIKLQDQQPIDLTAASSIQSPAAPAPSTRSPQVLYMLADLHALTVPQEPAKLRQNSFDLIVALLACGIDPARCAIFRQSRVPHHAELAWMLFCRTPVSWVSRMHQWKAKLQLLATHQPSDANPGSDPSDDAQHGLSSSDESSDDALYESPAGATLNVGLLSYPILQAADILLYRATHVPVGDDQSQHLNLTTMIARSFNSHYAKPVFVIPKSVIPSSVGKRIMSLRTPTSKMSKSDPVEHSRINIDDTADALRSKIRRATMDSTRGITYDPVARPGVTNLARIWMSLEKSSGIPWDSLTEEEIAVKIHDRFGEFSNEQFKTVVADTVVEYFEPIRAEILRLRKDKAYVESVLRDGEERARGVAERTMRDVRRAVGLQ
eukprot:jgi/Hompol1/3617/HPOL_003304-RA